MNYMPYPNPYQQQPYMANMQQSAQRYEVIRVNGRNGAEAFQMASNSNMLLLDESAPIVWLVQTDGAGYKTVTPYNITPVETKPEPVITATVNDEQYAELEARITKIEEMLADNGNKSNATTTKQKRIITDAG